MRVLMISYDRNMFVEGSDAYVNTLSYSTFMDELHVIIFSRKKHGLKRKKIGNTVWLYPTNGMFAWISIFKAITIGRDIKDVTIITTQDPFESGFVGYVLKKMLRVPLQIQLHGDFFGSDYWRKESVLNRGRRVFGKMLIRRANCIRVVSKRVQGSLMTLGIDEKKIVRNPIAISAQYLSKEEPKQNLHSMYPDADFIFLSAARFVEVKNLRLLVHAFHDVLGKHPKALLVLAGRGPDEKGLRRLTKQLEIEKHVIFIPWTEDLFSLYKTADAYVLTSNYEGWGKAVVEAMAVGLPVIMTNVGCAGEVVKDKESGFIVPVGSREKLGQAMVTMIEHDALREKLKLNALRDVQALPTFKEYLEIYRGSLVLCQRAENVQHH